MLEFAESIAGHGKSGHAVQAVFGTPRVGGKSCDLKLDWEAGTSGRGKACNVGVDAVGECGEDGERVGGVAFVFGFHVAAIAQRAGVHVTGQSGGAEDFGEASLAGAFPEFHLKETILSGDDALGEKQVMLVLGVDVGDSPAVAEDIDFSLETFHVYLA